MLCPDKQCGGKLRTIGTYQTDSVTYRTKLCCICKWKFTTREALAEDQTIPERIRHPRKWAETHKEPYDGDPDRRKTKHRMFINPSVGHHWSDSGDLGSGVPVADRPLAD